MCFVDVKHVMAYQRNLRAVLEGSKSSMISVLQPNPNIRESFNKSIFSHTGSPQSHALVSLV